MPDDHLTLADIAEIEMGQSPSGDECNTKGDGLPLLNGPTEFGARFPTPVQFTSDARKLAMPGDLLFCVRGSTTGRMNWADQEYAIGRGIAAIRHRSDPRLQPFIRAIIDRRLPALLAAATGSTFPNVSRALLTSIPIPDLDDDIVLGIATILAALDDKIELNRRMNETLEAQARALFRDWFVDFGPVKAKMAGAAPYLAPELWSLFPDRLDDDGVPEGWTEASIYEIANVVYGAPFASGQFNTEGRGRPLVRIRDLPKHQAGQFTEEMHRKEFVIEPGSLVVGMDGEFRAYIWRGIPSLMNQRVCAFRPNEERDRAFLWLTIEPQLLEYENSAIGTTVIHLGKKDIDRFRALDAGNDIRDAFSNLAEPLLNRLVANGSENRTLAQTRDLLLPKLMSGEIRVGNVERALEVSMIDRDQLKRSVVALLDSLAAEHPLGHQDSKAARYVLTTPAGAKIELMFEKNAKSPANLWVLGKAANDLTQSSLRFKRSPSSSLRTKTNAQGAILYGRHSALENMPQLGNADLYRFPVETLTDAGMVLDHLLALGPADLR